LRKAQSFHDDFTLFTAPQLLVVCVRATIASRGIKPAVVAVVCSQQFARAVQYRFVDARRIPQAFNTPWQQVDTCFFFPPPSKDYVIKNFIF
jgi:hypothetical protein